MSFWTFRPWYECGSSSGWTKVRNGEIYSVLAVKTTIKLSTECEYMTVTHCRVGSAGDRRLYECCKLFVETRIRIKLAPCSTSCQVGWSGRVAKVLRFLR